MQKYDIFGMSCAACSARVEKAVRSVHGVDTCAVNLLTNSMQVEGDVTPDVIIAAVRTAGYDAAVFGEKKIETGKEKIKARLITSLCILVVLMYFSMGHTMFALPLPPYLTAHPFVIAMIQFILAGAVMIINRNFFTNGFKGVIKLSPNMDTLVALGSFASFAYSTAIMIQNEEGMLHNLYFESAAMILALITVGKLLEAYAKGKTSDALASLMKLAPKTATIIQNGEETIVPIESVKVGDLFVVRPGDSIPVDGVICEGGGAINESSLTGESIPADKSAGDSIFSATLNQSGYIVARATRVGEDTTLAQIIKTVSDASASKAPIAKLADKVSGVFVPIVIFIAVITFVTWLVLGESMGHALSRGVSVLVISCPCALGLATPVAIMVGSGVGAKNGILFKTATALEITGKSDIVVLDKTGTITKGLPEVCRVIPVKDELIQAAYSLEIKSEHPLSRAIVAYGEKTGTTPTDVRDFNIVPGRGLEGRLWEKKIHGGNREYIEEFCTLPENVKSDADSFAQNGETPLFFECNGEFLGTITVADALKDDSDDAIEDLEKLGLKTVMLTGDNEKTAKAVADKVGISRVIAGVLPNGKAEAIRNLSGKVCMIGDGINDAPALSAAFVGMAIGSGTDIACESSDIVLMGNSLTDAVKAIKLSRATLKNIKENLFWAFFYNAIGIPLAAGVFIPIFGWELNPMFGAAAMSLSSFCVVTNALRLNFIKLKKEKKTMEKIIVIEGMMCPHCEARVKGLLDGLAQVSASDVSHVRGDAKITLTAEIKDSDIKKLIEDAGYKVIEIK